MGAAPLRTNVAPNPKAQHEVYGTCGESHRPADTGAVPLKVGAAPLRANVTADSLGAVVRAFKAATTRRINARRETPGAPVWQRNYYEHVIRNDADLDRIRAYILDNPRKWSEDPENPTNHHMAWRLGASEGGSTRWTERAGRATVRLTRGRRR
jgi:hypothetical protein